MNRKYLISFIAGLSFVALVGATFKSLMLDESGNCGQSVNFTGTTTLNSAAIATQTYSDGLVTSHDANGSAHSSLFAQKLSLSNNLSDLPSTSTARSNLGLKSASILDAGTGANNVPQLDASGKLLSSIFPASGVTAGTYGSGTLVPVIIVDSTGRITGVTTASVSGGSWGTITGTLSSQTDLQSALDAKISSPSSPAAGDILYWSGTAWVSLAKGADGQALILYNGLPAWLTASGLGDMLVSVYDPNSKGADAFDMDNMSEGSTNKILTSTERTNISNAASHVSSTSNPHSVTLDQAATAGATTTADVTVGDNFSIGDGTDTNKTIFANNGDTNKPAIRYNYLTSTWQYSNDGSTFSDMGSGSGGASDTTWTGSNWISTTKAPTQRAAQVALGEVALRYADRASAAATTDHGKPMMRNYADNGLDAYTMLLLHGDAFPFVDSSSNEYTITNSTVTQSTSTHKFGTGSYTLNCSSTDNHVYTSLSNASFGTSSPFTIDFWIYISSVGSATYRDIILNKTSEQSGRIMLMFTTSGYLAYNLSGQSVITSSSAVGTGAWHHVALVGDATNLKMYIDGTSVSSTARTDSKVGSQDWSTFCLGSTLNTDSSCTYYIDELRFSNVARWTAAFDPADEAYSASVVDNRLSSSKAGQNIISRTSNAPSIAAGTGAGTSPTISVAGTDNAGQITVTTGSSPTAAATIATITFASTYTHTPYVVISPANANAAALYNTTRVYATSSTSAITLTAGSAALTASTQYIWNYHAF